jgi:hypothetical protein
MNLQSVSIFLISCCLLVIGADADETKFTKAQELAQGKELVSKLSASNSSSKRRRILIANAMGVKFIEILGVKFGWG